MSGVEDGEDILDETLTGTMIGELEDGRYLALFPYMKSAVPRLRPGQIVAAECFSSERCKPEAYVLMEIARSTPVHYALSAKAKDLERQYPGFLIEAAKQVRQDWELNTPVEETAKIRAELIPIGKAACRSDSPSPRWDIIDDEGLPPMQGGQVIPLNSAGMRKAINGRIEEREGTYIEPCSLLVSDEVPVQLKIEPLIRTHAGIFGFTGTGKSNLMSTLVSKLINASKRSSVSRVRGLRIILIDYMLEYYPLLVDVFSELGDHAILLFLSLEGMPAESEVVPVLSGEDTSPEALATAARALVSSMIKPDELTSIEDLLADHMASLLNNGQVRVLVPAKGDIRQQIRAWLRDISPLTRRHAAFKEFETWLEEEVNRLPAKPSQNDVTGLANRIMQIADARPSGRQAGERDGSATRSRRQTLLQDDEDSQGSPAEGETESQNAFPVFSLTDSARQALRGLARDLRELSQRIHKLEGIQPNFRMGLWDLINQVNQEEDHPLLVIAYSEKPDELRRFFSNLAYGLYNTRRERGQSGPLTLLAVDEADEFVTREKKEEREDETYRRSRSAAETIARRGRKLGLGLLIATQRAAYLDTKTVGQLHTYFVSKLPRKTDRETVAEAMALDRQVIDEAVRFRTGEWLVLSHNATGLKGVPIPARFENAIDRVLRFLKPDSMQPE